MIDLKNLPPVISTDMKPLVVKNVRRSFAGSCNACNTPKYDQIRIDPECADRADVITEIYFRSTVIRLCARCAVNLREDL